MRLFALIFAAFVACIFAIPTADPNIRVIELFNTPAGSADNVLSARADGTIQLKMGRPRQSIGDAYGEYLYQSVYNTLQNICIYNSRKCSDQPKAFTIRGIEKHPNHHPKELKVWLKVTDGDWHASRSIHDLMIATIAGVIQAASRNEKNCIKYGNSTLCEIGDFYGVTIPPSKDTQGKESFLHVFVASEAFSLARYDCVSSLAFADSVLDSLKPGYEKVLGKNLDRNAWCVT